MNVFIFMDRISPPGWPHPMRGSGRTLRFSRTFVRPACEAVREGLAEGHAATPAADVHLYPRHPMESVSTTEYILEIYDKNDPLMQLERFLSAAPLTVPRIGEAVRLTLKDLEMTVVTVRHEMGARDGRLFHFIRVYGEMIRHPK